MDLSTVIVYDAQREMRMCRPAFLFFLLFLLVRPGGWAVTQAARESPGAGGVHPAPNPPSPGGGSSRNPPSPGNGPSGRTPPPAVPQKEAIKDVQSDKRQTPVRGFPLPPMDAVKVAIARLPQGKVPVTGKKGPLFFLHDIDADDTDDILLLAVGADGPDKAAFGQLSDFRRLFDPEGEDISFSVEVFLRKSEGIIHAKSIDGGSRRVCSEFAEFLFPTTHGLPYGLTLLFPAIDGKEHLWVFFPSPGKHSVFSFREKADVKAYIRDIDGNGIPDLLLFEDVFEDSTGYETYITWFRWDGSNFRKHRSTNIVRNLRKFFDTAGDLLLLRNWKRFLDFTLAVRDAETARKKDAAAALDEIFKFSPVHGVLDPGEGPSFSMEMLKKNVTEVVFPDVLENPFPLGPGGPESFLFTFRVAVDGEYLFFTARLGMNPNPFSGKMFYFLPD